MRILFSALVVFSLAASPVLAAPSSQQDSKQDTVVEVSPIYDPIEPFNRAVFQFNRFVDFILLKPVATIYTTITPDFAQRGVTNFLSNLSEPVTLLNTALQGDWDGFGTTFKRLYINTVYGLGGLFDVGQTMGFQKVNADFGQTMGKWGAGHGFYLVLPVIGPSSLRDGSGRVVDAFTDPYNIVFMDSETEWPIYARAGMVAVDARARFGDEFDRTMKTAVDPYVTFRSIYAQRRAYVVQDKSVDAYGAAETQY